MVITENSFGIPISEKIIIKNGKVYQVNVEEVKTYGLYLDDGRTILFKVISKIETTEKKLVIKLQNIFPEIKTTISDSTYLLDLNDLLIPGLEKKEFKYFDSFSVQLMSMFNRSKKIELLFRYYPKLLKYFVGQVGESYAWHKGIDDSFSKDYPIFQNKSIGFHVGFGGNIILLNTKVILLANYTINHVHFHREKVEEWAVYKNYFRKESYYLSLNFDKVFISKNLFVALGGRYYFSELKEISEFKNFILLLESVLSYLNRFKRVCIFFYF